MPAYQREYVWTEKQVKKLLEDIDEQMDEKDSSQYFIGTVLVSPIKDKDDFDVRKHFEVIDGQQRLTTIFLILCALRALFKDTRKIQVINDLTTASYTDLQGDIKTNFKLEPKYENAGEVIKKIVQAEDGDPDAVRASIESPEISIYGSVEKLLNAYEIIYHFLEENYKDETQLKKYWGYLANKLIFIQISTDVSNALKIFETINERGVGLNPMDLLSISACRS